MSYRTTEIIENVVITPNEIFEKIKNLSLETNRGCKELKISEVWSKHIGILSPIKSAKTLAIIQRIIAGEINSVLSAYCSKFYVRVSHRDTSVFLHVVERRAWWFDKEIAKHRLSTEPGIWVQASSWLPTIEKTSKAFNKVYGVFPIFAACVLKEKIKSEFARIEIDGVIKDVMADSS